LYIICAFTVKHCSLSTSFVYLHRTYTVKIYIPSNFIAQLFTGNDRNLLTYPLIGVEVQSQTCVIFLNNNPRRFLDGLRSYSTRLQEHTQQNTTHYPLTHDYKTLQLVSDYGKLYFYLGSRVTSAV